MSSTKKNAVSLTQVQAKMILDMMEHPNMTVRFAAAKDAAEAYEQIKAASELTDEDESQEGESQSEHHEA